MTQQSNPVRLLVVDMYLFVWHPIPPISPFSVLVGKKIEAWQGALIGIDVVAACGKREASTVTVIASIMIYSREPGCNRSGYFCPSPSLDTRRADHSR
jgi:hypothetical protein